MSLVFSLRQKIFNLLKQLLPSKAVYLIKKMRNVQDPFDPFSEKIKRYRKLSIEKNHDSESHLSLLRMHAHIIDKGLHREDWEAGHSESNYRAAMKIIDQFGDSDEVTLQWAIEIIQEYRRRQDGNLTDIKPFGIIPSPPPINPSELLSLLNIRTSSRAFNKKKVLEAHVEKIVEAALQAASSSNRQTLKIYATIDYRVAVKLASCFHGFTGFSDFVPSFFLFCVDLRSYSFPRELFVPTLDTALAVANGVLMASSIGMSMTQLIWLDDEGSDKFLRDYFCIPEYEVIVIGAVCGFPERVAVKPVRKDIESTLLLK